MRHLALPLRLDSAGRFVTVEADSAEDVAQSVGVLLATRPGERTNVPAYGTPEPQADGPDLIATQGAVQHWESRVADYDVELTVTENNVTVQGVS